MNQPPTIKAVRTLGQGSISWAVFTLVTSFGHIRLTDGQELAILVLATPLVTFLQNWIEDHGRANSETEVNTKA